LFLRDSQRSVSASTVASTLQRSNQEQEICSVANVTFPLFRYYMVLT
jgi:hypothetical protein